MVGAHPKPIYLPKNGISKEKKNTNIILFGCPSIFPKGENGPVFCKLNPFLWTCWSWCSVMPSEHPIPEIRTWDKIRQY